MSELMKLYFDLKHFNAIQKYCEENGIDAELIPNLPGDEICIKIKGPFANLCNAHWYLRELQREDENYTKEITNTLPESE